jgi:hypothetical protein
MLPDEDILFDRKEKGNKVKSTKPQREASKEPKEQEREFFMSNKFKV